MAGSTSTIVGYCFVVLQPVNANVLLNDTSELEARVEILEVEMTNVQSDVIDIESDVANIEGDINNVEIQINNLENQVNIVESEMINIQEDITDNEDQIFGMHIFSIQIFCDVTMFGIQKIMPKNIKLMQPQLLATFFLAMAYLQGQRKALFICTLGSAVELSVGTHFYFPFCKVNRASFAIVFPHFQ